MKLLEEFPSNLCDEALNVPAEQRDLTRQGVSLSPGQQSLTLCCNLPVAVASYTL